MISGQVFGEHGKPADKVKVRAEILDGKMHVLVYPFACSDAAGHFVIDASDFGVRPEQTADDSMFPDCFYDSSPRRAKP